MSYVAVLVVFFAFGPTLHSTDVFVVHVLCEILYLLFRATIVQEAYIYWTEVYSKVLRDPEDTAPAECKACRFQSTVVTFLCVLTILLARTIY